MFLCWVQKVSCKCLRKGNIEITGIPKKWHNIPQNISKTWSKNLKTKTETNAVKTDLQFYKTNDDNFEDESVKYHAPFRKGVGGGVI